MTNIFITIILVLTNRNKLKYLLAYFRIYMYMEYDGSRINVIHEPHERGTLTSCALDIPIT